MEIFKKTPQIKFMKYKVHALILTGIIVAAGLVNVLFFNGLKPGIDFGGGTLIRVMFNKPMSHRPDPGRSQEGWPRQQLDPGVR